MQKPNNYEETEVRGDFTPVELGGHYAVIKNVAEKDSKNGDPMIVVSIDFDKKDAQAGYFMDAFKKDVRPDKKYPNQATQYILSEYQGKCTSQFKSFIRAFAESNGIDENKIKWGSDFTAQFKNKKIGVVFGSVEELYNGEVKKRRKIRWFCDYNKVADQNVPKEVLLDTSKTSAAASTDFVATADSDMEEIPFD